MTPADVVARCAASPVSGVGHTHPGSFATGVLPVCTGRATAAAGFMLNWAKRYRCGIRLGYTTSTLDSQGQVTEEAADPSRWRSFLDEKDRGASARLKEAVNSLTAIRSQQAPLYSAVKVKGKPLYRYARGAEVERPVRQVCA